MHKGQDVPDVLVLTVQFVSLSANTDIIQAVKSESRIHIIKRCCKQSGKVHAVHRVQRFSP